MTKREWALWFVSIAIAIVVMSIIMAACLCFVLPVLIMYLILQRKFIESIDRVGITG